MSRASEEVLLIVTNIKNKKCEGSMYMMGQRMAWMPQTKSTFTISYNYADIKIQKISPDTKEKVQLQVVLHDGNANTFHFANPHGRPAQVKDRESIKELLQQLLPKFRRKVSSELEEKNRMLQEDRKLFQLYKDLVVSGIVTADEFWAARSGTTGMQTSQEVGVSQAFLADIKPQTDGCNGLKYNLTADIIESIFRTYPAVKQKYAENVPEKLTEQEFWTRFFQSHYFHRDRTNLGNKDIFSDCAKSDEQDILKEISKPADDPLVDLGRMTDTTSGEGYGVDSDDRKLSTNAANISLIRRFNQHSTMVLKACDKSSRLQSTASKADATTSSSPQPSTSTMDAHTEDDHQSKKTKLQEKISFSDLTEKNSDQAGVSVCLVNSGRYLHGPTPITAQQYHTGDDILTSCQAVTAEVLGWQPQLMHVLHSSSAVGILMELSPGGALMQATTSSQMHQMVPADFQAEIRNTYSALGEILRHFWACFPIGNSKALEEKVVRMQAQLDRFRQIKLMPLREKQISQHLPADLTGHMEDMIQAAFSKFKVWQTKRMYKKS